MVLLQSTTTHFVVTAPLRQQHHVFQVLQQMSGAKAVL